MFNVALASSMLHCVNRNALPPKHLPKRITKIDLCASCVHYPKPKMITLVLILQHKKGQVPKLIHMFIKIQ